MVADSVELDFFIKLLVSQALSRHSVLSRIHYLSLLLSLGILDRLNNAGWETGLKLFGVSPSDGREDPDFW